MSVKLVVFISLYGSKRHQSDISGRLVPILSLVEQAPEFAEGLGVGFDELRRRAAFLEGDAALRARLIAAYEANRETREPSPHVEEQIYDGFFTDADHRLMSMFHDAPWPDRLLIIRQFDDARLRELGYRLVHDERPDLLDEVARRQHDNRVYPGLGLDNGVPWLTLREAIQQANDILADTDLPHIREHRNDLQRRVAEAMRLTL
jgi:exodeoxyribonuclease-1